MLEIAAILRNGNRDEFWRRKGVETAVDGSLAEPIDQNGLAATTWQRSSRSRWAETSLRSSPEPLSTTFRRRTARRRRNAHTPTTGPTSRHSAAATARLAPGGPADPRSTSMPSRRSAAALRPASRPGPSDFRCQRCNGGSPRSQAATRRPDSRRQRSTRSCVGSFDAIAAPAGRPCGRRSRSSSSSFLRWLNVRK